MFLLDLVIDRSCQLLYRNAVKCENATHMTHHLCVERYSRVVRPLHVARFQQKQRSAQTLLLMVEQGVGQFEIYTNIV